MLDPWHSHLSLLTQHMEIQGHFAPAKDMETALFKNLDGIRLGAGGFIFVVVRKEHDPNSEVGVIIELLTEFLYLRGKNLIGNLRRDAGAITRLRVRIDRASVHKTAQSPKTSFKDIIGTLTVDLGNKSDTASVMLVLAVVESGKFV